MTVFCLFTGLYFEDGDSLSLENGSSLAIVVKQKGWKTTSKRLQLNMLFGTSDIV